MGVDAAIRGNRAYLAGKAAAEIAALAEEHARAVLRAHIPDAAWAAVRAHQARSEPVFLVSGSLDVLVAPLAEIVGADGYRASTLAVENGRLTGRLTGIRPVGEGTVGVAASLAEAYGFSLAAAAAYGDRISDARLMARVARPVAVSPRRALARRARHDGWSLTGMGTGAHSRPCGD
jgi:HAD superfamily phosphoserine phosphatase-like hydrolase